jgi:ABC-type polysaccharide/polyol phosphate export permease
MSSDPSALDRHQQVRVITPATRSSVIEIWRFRELLVGLVTRDLAAKYHRSVLGFVWTLLNPLLMLVVLVAVFSHVVRIPIEGYWAFLLSGYFVWNFIIQTLNTGTYVFGEHASLLRSAAFPPSVLVLGQAIAKLLEFMLALLLVLIAIALFHHQWVPLSWVMLPILMLLQLLLVLGFTFPIATVAAFYYDVQHALPIALTTLFYVSPVFYPASMIPEPVQALYMLNPIAGLLTMYQQVVYEGLFPSLMLLGVTTAVSLFLFALGYALFDRFSAVYPEII